MFCRRPSRISTGSSIASLSATARDRALNRRSRGTSPTKKAFKAYPIGYFHIDIAEVQTAQGKLYLFVAIDRISKFAFVQLVEQRHARHSVQPSSQALVAAVPYRIHTVLTDNGIQFRFAPRYADGPTARYMTHMFDMRCRESGIEHRFTKIIIVQPGGHRDARLGRHRALHDLPIRSWEGRHQRRVAPGRHGSRLPPPPDSWHP